MQELRRKNALTPEVAMLFSSDNIRSRHHSSPVVAAADVVEDDNNIVVLI